MPKVAFSGVWALTWLKRLVFILLVKITLVSINAFYGIYTLLAFNLFYPIDIFKIFLFFTGSGIINGTKVYGRTCGAGVGPTCPTATCQVAPTLVKQLKDLKNCTGKCCDTDLCNDTPFFTMAPPTTVPTNQTTSSNHSTPGDQDQSTTAKTPGDGAASYKANVFLFITVMAGMALL